MMAECLRIRSGALILLLLIIIIIFLQVLPVVGDGGQHRVVNIQEKQPLAKMVIDTISMFKKSQKSSWEKLKTIIRDVQFKYFTPNLDFRGSEVNSGGGNGESGGTTAGRMKEAAEKSFKSSKRTAQESAKTAAEAVEGAVHKTADKVKEKLSEDDRGSVSRHDEL